MTKTKREIYAATKPVLRESTEEGKGSRTIEGYAIVFGVESRLIVDWYDAFREIISKDAITQEDLDGSDIKMTLWHNREKLLARANKGEGTLTLSVDDTGVKYSFEAPETPDGETAVQLVKRGDIAGASFTFWTTEENCSYKEADDGAIVRTVNKINEVYEMTLASDPAYPQTTAEVAREMPEGAKALLKKREEPEEREQKENGPTVESVRFRINNQLF